MPVTNKEKRLEPSPPVDFVIITALEEEREALLSALGDYEILDKGDTDIHTYYFAELQTDRRDQSRYQVIVTCLINMGPPPSWFVRDNVKRPTLHLSGARTHSTSISTTTVN